MIWLWVTPHFYLVGKISFLAVRYSKHFFLFFFFNYLFNSTLIVCGFLTQFGNQENHARLGLGPFLNLDSDLKLIKGFKDIVKV